MTALTVEPTVRRLQRTKRLIRRLSKGPTNKYKFIPSLVKSIRRSTRRPVLLCINLFKKTKVNNTPQNIKQQAHQLFHNSEVFGNIKIN